MSDRWVEIEFDCLPLRSVGRLDVPLDASPRLEQFVLRVKAALEKHGAHNSYYLHNARCTYHLTNDPATGMLSFRFEGVVLTDTQDVKCRDCDLSVELERETCPWLTEPIVRWLTETVERAVLVEFQRFIDAGDLTRARERIEALEQQSEQAEGFLGMYL